MDSGTTPWIGVQLGECTDGITSDTQSMNWSGMYGELWFLRPRLELSCNTRNKNELNILPPMYKLPSTNVTHLQKYIT